MNRPGTPSIHVCWPAERFYWALLDGDTSRRAREQLGYRFEGFLPGRSIDDVHVVYERLPGAKGRVVACGVEREALRADVDASLLALCPATAPEFLGGAQVDPSRFNVLTGDFLPRPVRRLNQRLWGGVLILLIACAAMIAAGLERRRLAVEQQIHDVGVAKQALAAQVLGSGPAAGVSNQLSPEHRLLVERRRLEQTRGPRAPGSASAMRPMTDASVTLGALLAVWPSDVHAQTERVTVGADSITVVARVPTMADAQLLADTLKALPGWQLQPLRSEARSTQVDVTLSFVPQVAKEPAP